jgi:putative CocE/NonD family hydrolase
LINGLDTEESRRRYVVENVAIKTTEGATITAVVVRPKLLKKMPALLEFSIEEAQIDGKEAASHGYVGVMAYARGTHGGKGEAAPFQHDSDDARAAISWITKQAWSDGSVGMYGGGYSGYVAFAAARKPLPALKAIATSDPTAPGVDFPMAGNIFRNSAYRWAFRVMHIPREPDKLFDDEGQWRAFNQAWYSAGKPYREFASVPGEHTTVFRRWLSHPSYDQYWRRLTPTQQQFAQLEIPVLTTSGYYADGVAGALYYFKEHLRANPKADHTLLIGPYDENAMQYGVPSVLRGYALDQTAIVDLRELRYQWFDSVMKGGKKPALLKDRVNYQAMGTNEWRSAASLDDVGTSNLRFYLEPTEDPDRNLLVEAHNPKLAFLPQTFDLADRDDVKASPPRSLLTRGLQVPNGEMYVSEPLPQPVEISGAVSGQLDLFMNKVDVDLQLAVYELLPNGDYISLFDPAYAFRASYARNRASRKLLKSGVRQQLPFKTDLLISRELQAGSRVVLVLGINKRPDQQINYGTGKDVSEESIEDAKRPLRTRWYNTSYIDLPFNK